MYLISVQTNKLNKSENQSSVQKVHFTQMSSSLVSKRLQCISCRRLQRPSDWLRMRHAPYINLQTNSRSTRLHFSRRLLSLPHSLSRVLLFTGLYGEEDKKMF